MFSTFLASSYVWWIVPTTLGPRCARARPHSLASGGLRIDVRGNAAKMGAERADDRSCARASAEANTVSSQSPGFLCGFLACLAQVTNGANRLSKPWESFSVLCRQSLHASPRLQGEVRMFLSVECCQEMAALDGTLLVTK